MDLLGRYHDFIEILKDSIVELEIDKNFREPKIYSERTRNRALNSIERDYEVKLTEKELDYINYFSSELCWNYSDDVFIYGGFKLNDLWSALVLKSKFWKVDFSLAPDVEVPEELKRFELLNWFDQQSWCDDWRYGCFIREKGKFPPQLAFFDKNWYTLLNMSLDEYFEAKYNSCGVCGWQYFYIDYNQEIPHLDTAYKDMRNAVDQLPKLFPKMSFTYHIEKLEELKKIKNLD